MPILPAALLLAAAAAQPPAASPDTASPVYAEGRVLVLVPPRFPKEALARGEKGSVSVSARIRTDGQLEAIRIAAEPPNEAFESAVMDVAPFWRLQPRILSPSCQAAEGAATVTIWFEIEAGEPRVRFTPSPPPAGVAPPLIHRDRVPVRFVPPTYPTALAVHPRAPREAVHLVYLAVAADGAVTGVTVAPLLHYRDFEPHIAAAARQWKFAPQPERWCAEMELRFGLDPS